MNRCAVGVSCVFALWLFAACEGDDVASPPDMGPPCELVSQRGCAPGMACDLDVASRSAGITTCRAADPAGTEGVPCAGGFASDDCAAGLSCVFHLSAPANSNCMKFCETHAECTGGPGALCVMWLDDGRGGRIPGALICSTDCDPLNSASSCPAAQGCRVFAVDPTAVPTVVYTSCTPAGTAGQGASCTTSDDCQAGFVCIGAGTMQCLKYCQVVPAMDDCPGGTTCTDTDTTIGTQRYGLCV